MFRMNAEGFGMSVLHNFSAISDLPPASNPDGAGPNPGLILCGDTLYGTAIYGGYSAGGTIFAINTNGSGFRLLHGFPAASPVVSGMNHDGYWPVSGLASDGSVLYGTTSYGGSLAGGTVYAVSTNGSGFLGSGLQVLHNFESGAFASPLLLVSNNLFGVTRYSASSTNGDVFSLAGC